MMYPILHLGQALSRFDRQLDGVLNVTSDHAGDMAGTANYAAVSSGTTNHAEAVDIEYDSSRLSLGRILKVFFSAAHNPTYLNRQGDDQGRHYRSATFYAGDEQKRAAQAWTRSSERNQVGVECPNADRRERLLLAHQRRSQLRSTLLPHRSVAVGLDQSDRS